jgi:hypothetical protein
MTERNPYPSVYVESDMALAEHVPARLSDEVFAASNTRYILVCTDVVFINLDKKTFYLALRNEKPAQGVWWPVGGSRLAGQNDKQAIEGILSRELGVSKETAQDIAESRRLKFARHFEVIWKDRQQEPQSKITHAVANLFSLEVTQPELEGLANTLNTQDFDASQGMQEFGLAELEALAVADEAAHPGTRSAYRVVIDHWHAVFDNPIAERAE